MRIDVVTIFPDYLKVLDLSLIGKAADRGPLDLHVHDLRDHAHDRHRTVDDTPLGGGAGMVMKPDVWGEALDEVLAVDTPDAPRQVLIVPTPAGEVFTQRTAEAWAQEEHLVFACGRYEGIDERVYTLADHVISLGDYVLTSGELASMVVIDAAVRKLPGVLGAAEGPVDESFTSGLLEYPQYTRPADFRGMAVPEVLTSGNHAAIARWRREQSLARTAAARPDLIAAAEAAGRLTPADQKFLKLLEPAPTGAAEGVS